jgi:hypothetical protein
MCSLARLVTVAALVWVVFLTTTAVYKVALNTLTTFLIHATNLVWLYATAFYASTLCFSCSARRGGICNVLCVADVVGCCFFPLHALTWFVTLAVMVLLLVAPGFIIDLFVHIPPGHVMVANDVFHLVPLLAIIVFVGFGQNLIWLGLRRCCLRAWGRGDSLGYLRVMLYVLWIFFGGAVYFLGYVAMLFIFFDKMTPQDVYGTTLSTPLAVLALAGVGLLVNGPLVIGYRAYTHLFDTDPRMEPYYEARAMLKTEAQMFTDEKSRENVHLAIRDNLSEAATALLVPLLARDVEESSPVETMEFPRLDGPDARVWRRLNKITT